MRPLTDTSSKTSPVRAEVGYGTAMLAPVEETSVPLARNPTRGTRNDELATLGDRVHGVEPGMSMNGRCVKV